MSESISSNSEGGKCYKMLLFQFVLVLDLFLFALLPVIFLDNAGGLSGLDTLIFQIRQVKSQEEFWKNENAPHGSV